MSNGTRIASNPISCTGAAIRCPPVGVSPEVVSFGGVREAHRLWVGPQAPDRPAAPMEEGDGMRCPFCRYPDSRVIDSREVDDGQAIRRRRACPECARRFTTVEEMVLSVVKRSGVTEPFSRTKVIAGVRRACQGRPVNEDALALLAQQVEEAVRATGSAEVPSQEVGLAILGPLRDLDEVAYLRFASVYRAFTSADDFIAEIRALHGTAARPASANGDPEPGPVSAGMIGAAESAEAVGSSAVVGGDRDGALDASGAAHHPSVSVSLLPPAR